eukprot:Gregarina_sp_Poly_1__9741@NODE_61_length_16710_cov_172_464520_g52_i0_p1_GENE_NODE_61_length_16710_cov_172_464520_g52_i0NODE_61_length_16710_cov_172_464520_g52_i0_p1_ORF_typecomplete_len1391_score206_10Sec16_C/PF12931_7/4_5e18ANAPC4_WD40/PF12894_7/0_00012ANAPC4_WD40/PF12894_7/9_5e05ANAPC4_WD40/PF12894_7/45ANAPC4_WD40/PF12894_7/8_2e03SRA1/PF07304_11/1_8e04SRA1/PF07304_11/1_8e04SRA1/PF07304_11/1_8e04SRA1/PF07304_11/5e07PQQ_2/PF13360_6/0_023PQQ_2/PF13360_6/1_5e04eIF2A/PF08662_11/1_1eIF2A/PF08662_11/
MTTHYCEVNKSAFIAWNSEPLPETLSFLPRDVADSNILVLGGRDIQDRNLEFRALRPSEDSENSDPFTCVPLISVERSSHLKCLNWCGAHAQERINSRYPEGFVAAGTDESIDLYDPREVLLGYQRTCEKNQLTVPAAVRAREDYGIVTRLNLSANEVQGSLTCCDFDLVDSFRVAAGTAQGTVAVFDATTGQKVTSIDVATAGPNVGCVTSLRWHPTTADFLGATTSNGCFHVLKGKNRKPLLTLTDPNRRRLVSGCVWFEMGKNAVVAYDDDRNHPNGPAAVIQLWDLRHTSYPMREVSSHHKKGIVGVDICRADQRFFSTGSRDGRCVTWAMANQSIIPYSEIHVNEAITDFSVFQAGSFGAVACQQANDKVTIHSIDAVQCKDAAHLKFAPNWVHSNHNSVDFGFGGQLAWFSSADQQNDTVFAGVVTADEAFVQTVDQFAAYIERYDLVGFCNDRAEDSRPHDPHEARLWDAIAVHALPVEKRAAYMISKLGIDQEAISQQITSFLGHRGGQGLLTGIKDVDHNLNPIPVSPLAQDSYDATHDPQDTTKFFEGLANSNGPEEEDEGDSGKCFSKGEYDPEKPVSAPTTLETSGEGFFTATGREQWNKVPLKFMREAFLIGNPLGAVEVAIRANRFCEAFILAQSIQDPAITKAVVKAYLDHVNDPFVTMLALSADQSYAEVIRTCSLVQWEEVMAFLVTYVYKPESGMLSDTQFKELATMLGGRLEADSGDLRAATIVYLFAGAFDEALRLISSFPVPNRRPGSTAMKITVIRAVDNLLQLDSACVHKLSMFIDRLVNNGRLKLAHTVLSIVKGGISEPEMRRIKLPGSSLENPRINAGQPMNLMNPVQMNTSSPQMMGAPHPLTPTPALGSLGSTGMLPPPAGSFAPPMNLPPAVTGSTVMHPGVRGLGSGLPPPGPQPLGGGGNPSSVGPMVPPTASPMMPPGGAQGRSSMRQSGLGISPPLHGGGPSPSSMGPPPSNVGQPPSGHPPSSMGPPHLRQPPSNMSPPVPLTMGGTSSILPPSQKGLPPSWPNPAEAQQTRSMTGPNERIAQNASPSAVGPPHMGPPLLNMGQPHMGAPPASMTQPHLGQPPSNMGLLGQPPSSMGQPPLGQPPSSMGQPPLGQPPSNISQPHMGQPPSNLGPLGHPPSGMGQPPLGQPQSNINQPHLGQPSSNMGPLGQPPSMSQPPLGQPPSSMSQPHLGQQPSNMAPPVPPAMGGTLSVLPPAQVNQISTHPAASITPTLQKGLPTPWPIPTEVQQKRSTTAANERINQQVQQASMPKGSPCPPGDVQRIREAITAYMNSHSKPGEAVNNDYKNRLNELCEQLQSGRLTQQCQAKISEYASACARSDVHAMGRAHQELSSIAWDKDTKHWLMMLRRLVVSSN